MKSIRHKKDKLDAKYAAIRDKITVLQDIECDHKGVHIKYRGNTGNYDPSSDSYWIEWNCPHCDKRWTTEQNPEAYALIELLKAVKI